MPASARSGRRGARRAAALFVAFVVASGLSTASAASAGGTTPHRRLLGIWEVQSLNGANNNPFHPTWGQSDTIYPRVAPANYVDGRSQPVDGPNARYVSNRIINDTDQQLLSERDVSQWAFVWGQFLDHTIALRLGKNDFETEPAHIPFDQSDPMEFYVNDLGYIFFGRSNAARGTGVTNPRQQINTVSSYIDAWAVYGGTDQRLEWLREGPVDGAMGNNGPRLLMPGDYLPRRDARGDPDAAPEMVAGGRLAAEPHRAAVTGDVRANENPTLLATQTLFAREHNRIVSQLPGWLSAEDKFQIARAVVIAEQQYITYTEFLPAMGVTLPRYTGYKPNVDASLTNEFATIGYRAHSQIRGEFKIEAAAGRYSDATLDALREMGVLVTVRGDRVELVIPLGEDAFFNPDLIELVELGPLLEGVGVRAQSKNDELISNLLRSFPLEFSGNPGCQDDPTLPGCVRGVNDLAAIDIARGRDHGMPTYNQLRVAYGLPAKTSFRAITGEATERFPADPSLTPGDEINDPDSLDFTALYDSAGNPTTPEAGDAVRGERRTSLAARLKAIYGHVDNVDAFVGLMAEPHLPGREFGELQLAIWRKEFTALRDGDRFFYGNDPLLPFIRLAFGIDYRKGLGDLIALNTDIPRRDLADNVFLTEDAQHRDTPARDVGERAAPRPPATRAGLARHPSSWGDLEGVLARSVLDLTVNRRTSRRNRTKGA